MGKWIRVGEHIKIGKYLFHKDVVRGKLSKEVEDDFDDAEFPVESPSDEKREIDPNDTSERWEHTETIPCPFNLDNPDVVKGIAKPVERTNLKYELDLDISLNPRTSLHKHDIWTQVNPLFDDSDFNEIDLGELSCNLDFDMPHKAKITQSDKKDVKTPHLEKIKELIENNPHQRDKDVFNKSQKTFSQLNKYIEENLGEELKRLVDRLVFEYFTLYERGEERQEYINIIINEEEKALRKRLQAIKGRIPIKHQKDFHSEREKFIERCFAALEHLEKKKQKLLKSKMAEIVFSDLNPQQSLRRKLKVLDLTFEDILQEYSEQKSS